MRRRTGFVVASVIAGVGIVAGLVIAIVAGTRLDGAGDLFPELRDIQSDGTPFTVDMRPGYEWRVFVADPQLGGTPDVSCSGGGVAVRRPSTSFSYTTGGVEWSRELILTVETEGTYQVTCVAGAATGDGGRLAMQDAAEPGATGRFLTGIGGIVVGVGVMLLGLLIGGIVALVAAVQGRRSP